MLSALSRAFAQLPDSRIRRVLLRSIALTLAGALLLGVGVGFALDLLQTTSIAWLETLIDTLAGAGVFLLALVFFPTLVALLSGLFLDEVAAAVDARYYPALPPPRSASLRDTLLASARFAGVTLGLNVLALPLYLIPVVNLILFYAINGYLLSREFFEQAAHRRLEVAAATALRQRYQTRLWLLGALLAFFSTIPLLNLLLPILGTATLIHVVEVWRPRHSAS